MPDSPKISDAEWEVMKVIWDADRPMTSKEIVESISQRLGWHEKTIRTLITRLHRKGALNHEKEGRSYLYRATVRQDDCSREAAQNLLDRVFGGSLRPMLAQFVEEKRLSKREIEELKRLLEDQGEKD